jgi:hypothetical protein
MRGPSSPEAGTPDRPVLKGKQAGPPAHFPRSILRQRGPRHITLAGEPLGDRCRRSAGSRAVSPRSARELSSPRGSPRLGPLSSPARTGQTQKNGARQGFCDGYRATAHGPAPREYCKECGKRNKSVGKRLWWTERVGVPISVAPKSREGGSSAAPTRLYAPPQRKENWPYELCLPWLCCLARQKARRRVVGLRPEFWL